MKNYLVIGIVLALVLAGGVIFALNRYGSKYTAPILTSTSGSQTKNNEPGSTTDSYIAETFEGTLPCADCSGLKTIITFEKDTPNSDKGNYILSENYLGKSAEPLITKGNWIMTRGISSNPDALVYELNSDVKGKEEYYLKIKDTAIKPLDSSRNEIDSPFDMTLTKSTTQITSMGNPASKNCSAKGGTLVIEKSGNGGEYGLCNFEGGYACEEWALLRGDCPVGGVRTTGFDTVAQKYCAWVGGQTLAVANAQCTFKDGSVCSDEALFNSKCAKGDSLKKN